MFVPTISVILDRFATPPNMDYVGYHNYINNNLPQVGFCSEL